MLSGLTRAVLLTLLVAVGAGAFSFAIIDTAAVSGSAGSSPAASLVPRGAVVLPELSAAAAYAVYDDGSGTETILLNKRASDALPIASITKLATAAVILRSTTTETVTITNGRVSGKGSLGRYESGETFSVEALVAAMLIESDNDAAQSLANAIGQNFAARMNAFAEAHGLTDTHFYNPTGLDPAPGAAREINRASARDVLHLLESAYQIAPKTVSATGKDAYLLHDADGAFHHIAENTNELVTGTSTLVVRAGKTGHTPRAKKNLVVIVDAPDGAPGYIGAVVLNADNHFKDMRALLSWAERSFNWQAAVGSE